ncbi:MAG: DUF2182 domain-containing protein, partial [Blastocatellia bacterium]
MIISQSSTSVVAVLFGRSSTRRVSIAAVLLAGALLSWLGLYIWHQHPVGFGPGPLGWFMVMWLLMTAAMMLPSATPLVLVYSDIAARRAKSTASRPTSTAVLLLGYFIAWSAYGLLAYGAMTIIDLSLGNLINFYSARPYIA